MNGQLISQSILITRLQLYGYVRISRTMERAHGSFVAVVKVIQVSVTRYVCIKNIDVCFTSIYCTLRGQDQRLKCAIILWCRAVFAANFWKI